LNFSLAEREGTTPPHWHKNKRRGQELQEIEETCLENGRSITINLYSIAQGVSIHNPSINAASVAEEVHANENLLC
jgi:hypothetical protein